jgi:hypothetical protein
VPQNVATNTKLCLGCEVRNKITQYSLCMCDLSVVVRYICAWPYDCGFSKYKLIVMGFCYIHIVDVLLNINNTLLLLSVLLIITVEKFCFFFFSVVLILQAKICIKLLFT